MTGGAYGDADARFRAQMLPHLDAVHSYARYLCRDASLAEDLVQEAYLNAYRAMASYRGAGERAWLFTILRHCWHDWAEKRARETGVAAEPVDEADDCTPEAILMQQGTVASVRAAIEALPQPFREAIVLREIEALSYREIAAITGVPMGTVMSRLARGRPMLAALLRASGQDKECVE